MARLTIEQVKAPDLTGTSEILARAGESFNAGMDSAASLLGKYQEGQQKMGDKAILSDLAKIKDEAGLDDYLAQNPLAQKNLSDAMMQHVLGLRSDTIEFAADRADVDSTLATTADTRAGTVIKNAAEGRTAAENADMVAARTESRNVAGQMLGLVQQGRATGNGAAPAGANTREVLARTLQAEAGNQGLDGMIAVGSVIRNRADSGKYGDGIEGVIMKPGQFSAWNSVTGYANGEQGQDMNNMTPSEAAYAAADRVLAGQYDDVTQGATHYFNPDISQPKWAEGKEWSRVGDHIFGNADGEGSTGPRPRPAPITVNPATQSGIPQQLASVLGGTSYMDTNQMLALAESVYGAQATGQTAIDTAEAKAAAERQAALLLSVGSDVNNVTPQDAAMAVAAGANGVTATERLAQLSGGTAAFGEGGALAPILSPGTGMDPITASKAEAEIAEVAAQQERSITVQALEGAKQFESSPAESLVAHLEGMGATGMVAADLEGQINKMAKDLEISPGEAAYSFARAAENDQNWLVGADGLLTIFADGLSQNKAKAFAEDYFTGDGSAETRQRLTDDDLAVQAANLAKVAYDKAMKSAQKDVGMNGEMSATVARKLQEAEDAYNAAMDNL